MMLRCVKGNIGLDGVRYSIGDVFDVDDDSIADTLIGGKWAVADGVATIETDVNMDTEPDTVEEESDESDIPTEESGNDVVKEPEKPKRGRQKK
jgi:hypothetical protein